MFDVAAAQQAGRTDDQILDHLASQFDFNTEAALKAGKTKDQIISHLADTGKASMGYLQSKGWTKEQAAGIVGNLHVESAGLNPTITGDGGKSYGLAQWNGKRREALFSEAEKRGEKTPSIRTQLDFIHDELNGSESKAGEALRKANNPKLAVMAFSYGYERPGKPLIEQRIQHAEDYYQGKTPVKSASKRSIGDFQKEPLFAVEARKKGEAPRIVDEYGRPIGDQPATGKDITHAISPATDVILPLAGAAAGAAATIETGPGAIAGGGLGYAAGKQAARGIREYGGREEAQRGFQPLLEAGKDVIEGALYSAAGPEAGALKQIAGAGLSYSSAQELDKAYRIATDQAQPESFRVEAWNAIKGIMEGSAFAGAFHAAIEGPGAVKKGAGKVAERTYESALKPSTAMPESQTSGSRIENRRQQIKAGLENEIAVTGRGYEKLDQIRTEWRNERNEIVKKNETSGANFPTVKATKSIDEMIADEIKHPTHRSEQNIAELQKLKEFYLNEYGEKISFEDAHRLKQKLQRVAKTSYGKELSDVEKEGARAIARDARAELGKIDPSYEQINKNLQGLERLDKTLAHRIQQEANRPFLGTIKEMLTGGTPGIKSHVAFGLKRLAESEKPPVDARANVPVEKPPAKEPEPSGGPKPGPSSGGGLAEKAAEPKPAPPGQAGGLAAKTAGKKPPEIPARPVTEETEAQRKVREVGAMIKPKSAQVAAEPQKMVDKAKETPVKESKAEIPKAEAKKEETQMEGNTIVAKGNKHDIEHLGPADFEKDLDIIGKDTFAATRTLVSRHPELSNVGISKLKKQVSDYKEYSEIASGLRKGLIDAQNELSALKSGPQETSTKYRIETVENRIKDLKARTKSVKQDIETNFGKTKSAPKEAKGMEAEARSKEPWEMTAQDYGRQPGIPDAINADEAVIAAKRELKITQNKHGQFNYGQTKKAEAARKAIEKAEDKVADAIDTAYKKVHSLSVEQALKEGKLVPAEVLKDYPELASKEMPKNEAKAEGWKTGKKSLEDFERV